MPLAESLFGPILETQRQIAARLTDSAFRAMRWRRQQRLMALDPLVLDPRIDPRSPTLTYAHYYFAEESGETERWLTSPVFALEAAKRDPIDLCHLVLDRFHAYLEGRTTAEPFLGTVRELLAAGRDVELGGRRAFIVPNEFQIEGYAPHALPWTNAMVQGWAGSLFARAYQLSNESQFAEAAVRAIQPFFVDVAAGGVRAQHAGDVFFEKYAVPGQIRHVLNGFTSSLFNLWDVARATRDASATLAFEEGIASLSDRLLESYDTGYSTLYDQHGDGITPRCAFYTWVHARHLAALARITRSTRLWKWADKWRTYTRDPQTRMRTALACLGYRARAVPRYFGFATP